MMTMGVASAKMSGKTSYEGFRFPQYMSKMSRSRSMRSLKSSICWKLASSLHTTTKRISADVFNSLRAIALNDPEFRVMLVKNVGLEPEELALLMDSKVDSKIVKEAFLAASEKKVYPAPAALGDQEEPDRPEKRPSSPAGKSLFEF